MAEEFSGTAAWLRKQWSNPGDIFTVLLIIGGEIVRVAVAQLSAGPIPYLTPVSFSFGWVSYAVSAMLSAVGDNRLMPEPELDCALINAKTGYERRNCSWVLSRMLRDFDHWRPRAVDDVERTKLDELREANDRSAKPRDREDIRIALRVSVWQCTNASGKTSGDAMYWIGIFVALAQIGISVVPWALYGEWFTFMVTMSGTVLAFASGALPQWADEKIGVRHLKQTDKKDVFLTEGNGAHDAILILGCHGGMDLEALASPYRELRSPWTTRVLSLVLAILWIALIVSVAGWEQHTWYLLGVGILGIIHNIVVAGMKREPKAFGIYLDYKETIVGGKVMEVLWKVEEGYPRAGESLVATFFPGKVFAREALLWQFAERRAQASKELAQDKWRDGWGPVPPLQRPAGLKDDSDIPAAGPYHLPPGIPPVIGVPKTTPRDVVLDMGY